jgi:ubiquinone/menaquinone biosynthesis C-methylase UbiE
MLARVLEPEVMDTEAEARDYDAMDHSRVNALFCEDLLAVTTASPVLDVGTGTAQIPIELCRRAPDAKVVAIDLAEHMLSLGRANVASAGLSARIELRRVDAKLTQLAGGSFPTVMSNSIVHHIPEPSVVLAEMWRLVAPGGWLFVRDLSRPSDERTLDALVTRYAGEPPPDPAGAAAFLHQRDLFRASLHAALTADEIADLVAPLGVRRDAVSMTSDRHWTLIAQKGPSEG